MLVIQENRENPRLKVCLGSSIRNEEENNRGFSIVRDISATGIYITTKKLYLEGTGADCIISLDDDAISFRGEVVRSCHDESYYGYGIEITDIDDKDSYKLEKFIDEGFSVTESYPAYEPDSSSSIEEEVLSYGSTGSSGNYNYHDIGYLETDGRGSRLIQAGFPFFADMEGYDLSYQTEEVKSQVDRILALDWVEEAKNVILFGPAGSGKTHLAIGVGVKAIDSDYRVTFTTMADLLDLMKNQSMNPASGYRLDKIVNSRVVVIDEIDMIPLSKQESNLLFQFVSKLYGKTSMIITADTTFDKMKEVIGDTAAVNLILNNLAHSVWLRGLVN